MESDDSFCRDDRVGEEETREGKNKKRSGRHGARNERRHKNLARWLLSRFPDLLSEDALVLDVAGGKGELAARLTMCHKLRVVMVDPRPADVPKCFETVVLRKLPNKWQHRLDERQKENPSFLKETIQSRFRQLVMCFDEKSVEESEELQEVIQESSLIVGMHADGATEPIVNAAIRHGKPFVAVPCCVFPRLFPQRMVEEHGEMVQVRSHDQFCKYLVQKHPGFVMETLPFEGRNVAIWWDGVASNSDMSRKAAAAQF
mmetsp:Transcript_16429/g.37718  ORF Transcript_16429/g.37718 Transcript_16429/m.37718 type:complete len:259 (+) Transcript_16429:89-865(+)